MFRAAFRIAFTDQCCIAPAWTCLLCLQLHEMDVDVSNKLANCDTFCDVVCLLNVCLSCLQLHEMDVDVSSKLANCDTFCDVVCLLYDVTNPHTFKYCAQLYTVLSFCNKLLLIIMILWGPGDICVSLLCSCPMVSLSIAFRLSIHISLCHVQGVTKSLAQKQQFLRSDLILMIGNDVVAVCQSPFLL